MPQPGAASALHAGPIALVTALTTLLVLFTGWPAAAAADTQPAPAGRVVIIGVPGLRWSDLSEAGTPALWDLTGRGAAAALSVRTTTTATCPVDGWLTLSAGQRARFAHGSCALPSAPVRAGTSFFVPGFVAMRRDNANTSYEAEVGLLGEAVRRGGGCTMAVGAGGVFGAADRSGRVDRYASRVDQVTDWSSCALTVVDVDDIFRTYITAGVDARGAQVPVTHAERTAAAASADLRIGSVLRALPAGTTVLLAGLSDTGGTAHLHVALANKPRGYMASNATRRPGVVTLTDVTSTALRDLGLRQPAAAVGSPWRSEPSATPVAEKINALDDEDVAARSVSRVQAPFFILLFGAQLLMYGVASVVLRRRPDGTAGRRRVLAGTRLVALAGAAVPVASFLANLVPWWRSAHPAPALIINVLVATALVTALALAGPWRRSLIAPALVIAGITAVTLGLDVLTGSTLQINSLMGYTALIGGRFYGFGNIAFALFATGAILTAAWLAEWPLRAGRRRAAVALVVGAGAMAAALDGWPTWGSDFGGVLAIVPGTAVLALMIAGSRISPVKVALIGVAAVTLVLAIAFADALRPATEQTHLGRFWDELVHGDAWGLLGRKLLAMLYSLRYWQFTVIAVGAICFLFFVLARPLRWRAAVLADAYARTRTLRPALTAALTTALIGMLVNDSGVVIPAIALGLAVPLTLAAGVRGQELADRPAPSTPPPRPGRSESRPAPTG